MNITGSVDDVADINIVNWNIAGIATKISILAWKDFIGGYDFCCFQETWDAECTEIEGFTCYLKPARKPASGRLSGGTQSGSEQP